MISLYKYDRQGWEKHIGLILLDVAMLELALGIAYFLRHGEGLSFEGSVYRDLAVLYAVVDMLICIVFNTMSSIYRRGFYKELVNSCKHALLVLCTITICIFCLKSGRQISRIVILVTTVLHIFLGYLSRLGWKAISNHGAFAHNRSSMILVADEKRLAEIMSRLTPFVRATITGLVLSNRDATGEMIEGIPVVAGLETAADYICRKWVDEVFVFPEHLSDMEVKSISGKEVPEDSEPASVGVLIGQCEQMAIPIHICLSLTSMKRKQMIERVGGYDVITSVSNYALPGELLAKRLLDILGGIVGSIMALCIMAIVGPMIKRESPGPILFKQTRIGQNGRRFGIYKLRSMHLDAEDRKKELLQDNRVSDGMMFKLDWDPRIIGNKIVDGKQVTGIGEFIRVHSLDEFPQFFNVLLNQMSLVGTRPPTVDEWEKYRYHHRARLATKPGITGLWQVSGRSEITDFEEVVKLDTEYINNWSLKLDIKILLKTIQVAVTGSGAM